MKGKSMGRSEQDRLLDEALGGTFPASDPVSMQQNCIVGAVPREQKSATRAKRPKTFRSADRPVSSVLDAEPGSPRKC
jgi:hypothetical protein